MIILWFIIFVVGCNVPYDNAKTNRFYSLFLLRLKMDTRGTNIQGQVGKSNTYFNTWNLNGLPLLLRLTRTFRDVRCIFNIST